MSLRVMKLDIESTHQGTYPHALARVGPSLAAIVTTSVSPLASCPLVEADDLASARPGKRPYPTDGRGLLIVCVGDVEVILPEAAKDEIVGDEPGSWIANGTSHGAIVIQS